MRDSAKSLAELPHTTSVPPSRWSVGKREQARLGRCRRRRVKRRRAVPVPAGPEGWGPPVTAPAPAERRSLSTTSISSRISVRRILCLGEPWLFEILGYESHELVAETAGKHPPRDLPQVRTGRSAGRVDPPHPSPSHRDGTWRCFESVAVDYQTPRELRRIGIARLPNRSAWNSSSGRLESGYRRLAEMEARWVCEVDAEADVYANRRYRDALGFRPRRDRRSCGRSPRGGSQLLQSTFIDRQEGAKTFSAVSSPSQGRLRAMAGRRIVSDRRARPVSSSASAICHGERSSQDERERLEAQIRQIESSRALESCGRDRTRLNNPARGRLGPCGTRSGGSGTRIAGNLSGREIILPPSGHRNWPSKCSACPVGSR